MEKSAKITRTVFKNEWKGPNGAVYYHEVELDNGDKGQIGCKENMPSKLNPGNELKYTIEQDPRGGFKIKSVVEQKQAFSGGGRGGRQQVEPRIQMISFAMSYAKDLAVAGKIDVDKIPNYFKSIYKTMTEAI